MKLRRKFNLRRIGIEYESVDIEVEGEDAEKLIAEIEAIWKKYSEAIVNGKVS